jgi:hypothetical protein
LFEKKAAFLVEDMVTATRLCAPDRRKVEAATRQAERDIAAGRGIGDA